MLRKPPKKAPARAKPEVPRIPRVRDLVVPEGSTAIYPRSPASAATEQPSTSAFCTPTWSASAFRCPRSRRSSTSRAIAQAISFTLTAVPLLLAEGEYKGHLEYVSFIASEGGYSKKWSATNGGTFAEDFAI